MSIAQTQFEHAQKLQSQGQLLEALDLFKELLQQDPANIAVIQHVCLLYVQMDMPKKAEQVLKAGIKELPQEPSLYNSCGNLALRQQDYHAAINAYQQALSLNPNYPGAHNNLGNAHAHMGNNQLAEQSYRNALKVDELYPDAHYNLARILITANQFTEALDHLHQVINIIPRHAAALGLLANLYLELENDEQAVLFSQKRLEIQPNHPATLQTLGNAYLKQKQLRLAITELSQALRLDATLEDIHQQLGTAFLLYGNRDDALQHYLRHLDQKKELDTLYNVGVIYSDLQRHSDAIKHFTEVLQINEKHLSTHLNLAAIYLKTGKTQQAIQHYQTVLALDPNNAEIKHTLHALKQDENPENAPIEYSQNLFDHYASGYDKHLIEILKYTVPEQIQQMVTTEINPKDKSLTILDLGCGTGLIGECLQQQASKLIGVDVSSAMLEKAKEKNIYHSLVNQSLQNALQNYSKQIDLVIAADVFPYLGDLDQVFRDVKAALTPSGCFIFSIEKTLAEHYVLQTNIRYAHNEKYIKSLALRYDFEITVINNAVLRRQHQKPVEGYLFLIKVK